MERGKSGAKEINTHAVEFLMFSSLLAAFNFDSRLGRGKEKIKIQQVRWVEARGEKRRDEPNATEHSGRQIGGARRGRSRPQVGGKLCCLRRNQVAAAVASIVANQSKTSRKIISQQIKSSLRSQATCLSG